MKSKETKYKGGFSKQEDGTITTQDKWYRSGWEDGREALKKEIIEWAKEMDKEGNSRISGTVNIDDLIKKLQ